MFKTEDEQAWVLSQIHLPESWPLDDATRLAVEFDFDIERVNYDAGVDFCELKLHDARLNRKNLRIFFWIHDASETIWIVHGCWKKTEKLDDVTKRLVRRRIEMIKGDIQDMSRR